MKSHLLISLLFLIFFGSCIEKSKEDLQFAFIGDIHYSIPDYRTAEYLVPSIAEEFSGLKQKPEFIIQTGDFYHAGRGADIESESNFAFKNFSENFGIPFFIAKGNHDTRSYYEKNSLPLFSQQLGKEINKSYYSFDKSNCHFIILDCTEEKLADQLLWLGKDLEAARADPKIDHIFVAGHYPLWIVARAGFVRGEYSDSVSSLLARYKVDAYLCGHTHNKTATVRLINGQPLTQIMDAGVVEENRLFNLAPFLHNIGKVPEDIDHPGILPLEEAHQIFIPLSESKYYWGYQEGSTTSYYIFTVNGKRVRADWHVLGQGVIRSFSWNKPGQIQNQKYPENVDRKSLSVHDIEQVEKAWLYTAPWTDEDSIIAPVSINGVPSGDLQLSRIKMAGSPFWNKVEIPVPRSAVDAIRMKNEISIGNPEKGKFGLAHMFLLVQFKNGEFAKSSISPKVLTSFPVTAGEYPNFPDNELIESVNQGEALAKVTLMFDKFY